MLYLALFFSFSQEPAIAPGLASYSKEAQNLLATPLETTWQGWVETEKQTRLKPAEIAQERKKSTSDMTRHWQIKNQALTFDGAGSSIETAKGFKDFDLWLEWKIPKHGDFVLLLRGIPGPRFYDFQGFPEEIDKLGSGGLFLNRQFTPKPALKADLPVGSWNKTRIRMRGDRVSVWLNGKTVVEEIPLENSWDRRKPIPLEGPIGLQGRGTLFEIRDLAVLPIQTP